MACAQPLWELQASFGRTVHVYGGSWGLAWVGGGFHGHTGGRREAKKGCPLCSRDAQPSAWFLQSFYQAILGWSFHLCGPSVKCFPRPGPPPGTRAPMTLALPCLPVSLWTGWTRRLNGEAGA